MEVAYLLLWNISDDNQLQGSSPQKVHAILWLAAS
jgi:hypothetical protein